MVDGLSPRVRGNRAARPLPSSSSGSIPACAGEPNGLLRLLPASTVYPRVCGGTSSTCGIDVLYHGLSPRVRGNPSLTMVFSSTVRSIPACAGEPTPEYVMVLTTSVYPRVCGGTQYPSPTHPFHPGLSPRVRGNRILSLLNAISVGSIPACAGEPQPRRRHCGSFTVYPRVCGGTTMEKGAE